MSDTSTKSYIRRIFEVGAKTFGLVTAHVEDNKRFVNISEDDYVACCLSGVNPRMSKRKQKKSLCLLKSIENELVNIDPWLPTKYFLGSSLHLRILSTKNIANLMIPNYGIDDKIWIEVRNFCEPDSTFLLLNHEKNSISVLELKQEHPDFPWWYSTLHFKHFKFGSVEKCPIFRLAYQQKDSITFEYSNWFIPVEGSDYCHRLQDYLDRLQGKKKPLKQKKHHKIGYSLEYIHSAIEQQEKRQKIYHDSRPSPSDVLGNFVNSKLVMEGALPALNDEDYFNHEEPREPDNIPKFLDEEEIADLDGHSLDKQEINEPLFQPMLLGMETSHLQPFDENFLNPNP